MQKKQYDRKKIAIIIGVLLLCGLLYFLYKSFAFYAQISTNKSIWNKPIPKEKKVFNILMMGYGGPGHDGAYLTDTLMLLHINTETKRGVLVSIPRDTWVKVPLGSKSSSDADSNSNKNPDSNSDSDSDTDSDTSNYHRKINSMYQMGLFSNNYPALPTRYHGEQGAGELLKEVVKQVTGVTPDYYIAIDFDGFTKAVDTLGGVEVNVEKSFTDPLYPIDGKEDDLCGLDPNDQEKFIEQEKIATESPQLAYPCRYENLHFSAGEQKMDGATALKFVRSRHALEDGGDFGRARRQQLFLEAVRSKVLSIGFLPKVIPLLNDLGNSVRTDVPPELLSRLINEANSAGKYSLEQLILTTDNYLKNSVSDDKQYILISTEGEDDWSNIHNDLELLIKNITPTPSVSVSGQSGSSEKK